MASDQEFVDYVIGQIDSEHEISYKKMFGEYGIYINKKIVGLICDNNLFIKPTDNGRKFIGVPDEVPPYPGAKNSFLIGEQIEDREWLSRLLKISYNQLPEPKPKKKKKK
ncbi:MAG: TfoX/Sxy family protein [Candidatus Delongbacteria bacterium]|nr:TfoX/Sxy family protein [Candidatus Delongbacteria bacterium]